MQDLDVEVWGHRQHALTLSRSEGYNKKGAADSKGFFGALTNLHMTCAHGAVWVIAAACAHERDIAGRKLSSKE
jgi:hypothetical protein